MKKLTWNFKKNSSPNTAGGAEVVSAVAPMVEQKPKSKWQLIWEEYRYLGFAFIIPILLMFLLYVAMELHPFGNGSVLVLDLNAQYAFFYEALRAWVWGDGSLL